MVSYNKSPILHINPYFPFPSIHLNLLSILLLDLLFLLSYSASIFNHGVNITLQLRKLLLYFLSQYIAKILKFRNFFPEIHLHSINLPIHKLIVLHKCIHKSSCIFIRI